MKRIILPIFVAILAVYTPAQNLGMKDHPSKQIDCRMCHVCEVPTKKDPCLVECPRSEVTIRSSSEEGPDVVVMNELEGEYGPVSFTHRIHSEMSAMSGGCGSCHHYNTLGPILNCDQCHETIRKREEIDLPDLKGAYHRQCMNCHREWSHSTDCTSCHAFKGMDTKNIDMTKQSGKTHPKVIEPTKVVYKTNSDKGKIVTFYHDDHTKRFGLDCINCHQQENCNRCHDVNRKEISEKVASSKELSNDEIHKNCYGCHQNDSCTLCHNDSEQNRFDHLVATGWKLNRFHENLSCNSCHKQKNRFSKLDIECTSCHQDWDNGKFDHSITGVILDETHSEFGCDFCHSDFKFSKEPDCSNCHDGYKFPDQVPGKRK